MQQKGVMQSEGRFSEAVKSLDHNRRGYCVSGGFGVVGHEPQ